MDRRIPQLSVAVLILITTGLEQAAHTFGLVRSLTLADESVESAIDCVVIGAFRNST
jgi:hypothetical protein